MGQKLGQSSVHDTPPHWRLLRPPSSGPVCMLVHDRPGCHRNDGFRGWRAVAQSTVRPLGVVVFPPFFDNDLRLFEAVEDFAV